MIVLSNKEILHELKAIGINTEIDLVAYLIKYKAYFTSQCLDTQK
jgi:hypothetical protein